MAIHTLLVISGPAPGREHDYNEWYEKVHIPQVMALPGFVSAKRYKLQDETTKLPGRYLILFEIDSDDPKREVAHLRAISGTSRLEGSDTVDRASVLSGFFQLVAAF